MKIYIQAFSIDVSYGQNWNIAQAWVGDDIQALGRMLKVVGVSQFETVWREVTDEELTEEWRSAIQTASEENEE